MRTYSKDKIKLQHNRKTGVAGTIDVVRGCVGCELKSTPCYASKGAWRRKIDFFHPVERILDEKLLEKQLENYSLNWLRIGCISDPSLNWNLTMRVCDLVDLNNIIPVVVTKLHQSVNTLILKHLKESNAQLQVSLSALAGPRRLQERLELLERYKALGGFSVARINSMAFKKGSKQEETQEKIIEKVRPLYPILDTPVRLFKTSPIWNLLDEEKYHRHLSPISGKLDTQKTAGLLIKDAYPCYSSCSKHPTETDPVACFHACITNRSRG